MKLLSLFQMLIVLCWCLPVPALAFDDDSSVDLRFFDKRQCKDGVNLRQDSRASKFACDHTEAFVDSRRYLYKNEKRVSNKKIIDFKLSRGGKVYYRRQIDAQWLSKKKLVRSAKLYDEKGVLNSGAGGVILYLIGYNGDAIYINERYEIYKNGKMLNSGAFQVPILRSRGDRGRIISPKVSLRGTAVYINDKGDLYKDGARLNPNSVEVTEFKIDQKANVYYLDNQSRLFMERRKIYNGPHKVQKFILKDGGGVGFLVDSSNSNLIFKGRKYSAGASKIISFKFNRSGHLIYRDAMGRRWDNGRQTGD